MLNRARNTPHPCHPERREGCVVSGMLCTAILDPVASPSVCLCRQIVPQPPKLLAPSYADCDLSSIRWLNSANSATNSSVSRPASVAASISVVSTIAVATSALHSRQYFSLLPGSSNNSVRRPHTPHARHDGSSLPFGPHNIDVPPRPRLLGLCSLQYQGREVPFLKS